MRVTGLFNAKFYTVLKVFINKSLNYLFLWYVFICTEFLLAKSTKNYIINLLKSQNNNIHFSLVAMKFLNTAIYYYCLFSSKYN